VRRRRVDDVQLKSDQDDVDERSSLLHNSRVSQIDVKNVVMSSGLSSTDDDDDYDHDDADDDDVDK
jgi:hypothetical protein